MGVPLQLQVPILVHYARDGGLLAEQGIQVPDVFLPGPPGGRGEDLPQLCADLLHSPQGIPPRGRMTVESSFHTRNTLRSEHLGRHCPGKQVVHRRQIVARIARAVAVHSVDEIQAKRAAYEFPGFRHAESVTCKYYIDKLHV